MASKATAEQRRALFVEAYCSNGGNGKQAAIAAGFAPRSAEVTASRLLRHAKVAKAVEKRRAQTFAKAQEKTQLTADEILASLARTVRFDPRKLYREDGSLKPVHELDADTADALAGVEVVEMAGGLKIALPAENGEEPVLQHVPMYTKKVKWLDKNTAREQGMKHFGLYEKDNEQKPVFSIPPGQRTVKLEFKSTRGK